MKFVVEQYEGEQRMQLDNFKVFLGEFNRNWIEPSQRLRPNLRMLEKFARKDTFFKDTISAFHPSLILEIGTWKGSSLFAWLLNSLQEKQCINLIAVDTWLGNIDMWEDWHGSESEFGRHNLDSSTTGNPKVFEAFQYVLNRSKSIQYVESFRMTSLDGLRLLKSRKLQFDLIYLDSDHHFLNIVQELFMSDFVVHKSYGVIALDDFRHLAVKQATFLFSLFKIRKYSLWKHEDSRVILVPRTRAFNSLENFGFSRLSKLLLLSEILELVVRSLLARDE